MSPDPPGQAPNADDAPAVPAATPADPSTVDLGALAFILGLLVLGVVMMLLMVHHG